LGEDRIRPSVYSPAQAFARSTAKSIAACRMHAEKAAWWAAMRYKGLVAEVC